MLLFVIRDPHLHNGQSDLPFLCFISLMLHISVRGVAQASVVTLALTNEDVILLIDALRSRAPSPRTLALVASRCVSFGRGGVGLRSCQVADLRESSVPGGTCRYRWRCLVFFNSCRCCSWSPPSVKGIDAVLTGLLLHHCYQIVVHLGTDASLSWFAILSWSVAAREGLILIASLGS